MVLFTWIIQVKEKSSRISVMYPLYSLRQWEWESQHFDLYGFLSQLFIHSILYLFSEDLLIPSRSQRMCWDEGYPVEEVPVHTGALVDDDIY